MDMYSENKADGSLPTEACQTKKNRPKKKKCAIGTICLR